MFAVSKYICTLFPAAISLQFLFDEAQFIMLQFFDKNGGEIVVRNYELEPGQEFLLLASILTAY